MRILHAAPMRKKSSGIINQMHWEKKAAQEIGLDWKVHIFTSDKSLSKKDNIFIYSQNSASSSNSMFRREYYEWLVSQEEQVDCYILRYSNFDYHQYLFIKKIKKPVYLVHHTLELPELLLSGTIKSFIQATVEALIGKFSIALAYGNIGVTQEILDYENSRIKISKKSIVYPNGIFYEENLDCLIKDDRTEFPEIVFIASHFYPWHGLDLLLKSIKNNNSTFKLHIIGNVDNLYKKIVEKDTRVVFHGHLDQSEIDKILSVAWVGLSSFALFRNKMKQACTLKVREYLKAGLPVYASYEEILPNDFPFYKNSDPNIESVLDYCYEMRKFTKSLVSKNAKAYISKKVLLEDLHNKIVKDIG